MKSIRQKLWRWLLFTFVLINTALASSVPVSNAATVEGPTDYDWQAIYLVKLSLDTQWPEVTMNGDMRIINVCVLGNSPNFIRSLQNITPKAEQKKLKITISEVADENLKGCNIVYFPRGKADYRNILLAIRKQPIMTMSPIDNFASNGGVVELILADVNGGAISTKVNVKFKINNQAANENGLKVGTDALKSAQEVIE